MAAKTSKLLIMLLGLITLLGGAVAASEQTSKSMNNTSTSTSSTNSIKSSTTAKALPGLSKTTTQSLSSSTSLRESNSLASSVTSNSSAIGSASSYVATFTPIVPNVSNDRYIYQAHHIGGTVFIAVGSCLGFILLVVTIAWAAFALSSWYSARKEYQLKEMESKYQYDPFYLSPGTDFNDTSSLNYSDGDENSDISEKVLKNKSSRLTLHTFGSGSVLNLLNQDNKTNDISDNANKSSNNNRKSMFISPTEVLQNEIMNQSNIWQDSNAYSYSLFESTGSTPKEQTPGQFINNPSLSNLASNPHWMQSISPKEYLQNNSSLLRPDISNSPLPDHLNNIPPAEEDTLERKKNYRPPSMHLEDLLDGNDDK